MVPLAASGLEVVQGPGGDGVEAGADGRSIGGALSRQAVCGSAQVVGPHDHAVEDVRHPSPIGLPASRDREPRVQAS